MVFKTGGTNFDAKLRRQSIDAEDLIAAHVGAMDVCARGFKAAAAMIEDGQLRTGSPKQVQRLGISGSTGYAKQ